MAAVWAFSSPTGDPGCGLWPVRQMIEDKYR